jgi:hypothetical protein
LIIHIPSGVWHDDKADISPARLSQMEKIIKENNYVLVNINNNHNLDDNTNIPGRENPTEKIVLMSGRINEKSIRSIIINQQQLLASLPSATSCDSDMNN